MRNRTISQRLKIALGVLFDSTSWQERYSRPYEIPSVRSIDDEVSPWDRAALVSDSRKLYCNLGPVKGAVDAKAMYAIGRSWLPKFEGSDSEWGKRARDWLVEQWYPLADIGGNDFQTALHLASVGVDVEADCGVSLTQYDTGFPAIQLIPGLNIGNRKYKNSDKLPDGQYAGLEICDGVVLSDQGRALAFHVLGDNDDGESDVFVSARDMMLLKEPQFIGQARGFPAFAASILDLKDFRTIAGYEKAAARLASSISLLEFNESGIADLSDPRVALGSPQLGDSTVVRDMAGGMVKLLKAGTGAKIEAFYSQRPGDAFERLRDHIIRTAMSGINWHYELAWDISKAGGANTRFLIASAMRTVEDRQDLLRPIARRSVGYAVAKAIKLGMLPANEEWYKWGFTMPARMTADYGRDKAQDREDYIAGITNLSDICDENGIDIDQHIADRKAENEKLLAAGLPLPITPQQAQIHAAEASASAAQQDQPQQPDPQDIAARAKEEANVLNLSKQMQLSALMRRVGAGQSEEKQ